MIFSFYTNNTLGAVGSYRIVTFAEPFIKTQDISAFSDTITGGVPGADVQRAVRYSTDQVTWSLWIDFDLLDLSPITGLTFDEANPLYLEFKYTGITNPLGSPGLMPGNPIDPPFVIGAINMTLTYDTTIADPYIGYVPPSRCSDEFSQIPIIKQDKFTFDPYAVNKGLNLYKELSSMTNEMFGHEIVYYRVNPQGRSADVILKEWTIQQVEQQKCLKILVPNNEFPDSKPQFNNFGIDFEIPFEVHIDKGYWETYFGMGTMPQEFDIIYFPLLNRLYEIQSTYVYRDFMQEPLYFKAQLVKYQKRASVLMPDNIAADIDALTISTEELFGEEVEREIKRITKPEQFVTITHAQDPTRHMVNKSMPINRFDLYNHWTLVSEHFYDLESLYTTDGSTDAVIYRANAYMKEDEGRAFTFWINPKAGSTVAQERPLLVGMNGSNVGMNIDLVYGTNAGQSAVRLTINTDTYLFALTSIAIKDQWYALVVNVSNQFGQAGVNLWTLQDNTTEMSMVFSKNITITPSAFDAGQPWKLKASPIHMTNIRIFGTMLEQEKQSLVLNQMVVQDSDEALVIDNAKNLLRLPRITNPK